MRLLILLTIFLISSCQTAGYNTQGGGFDPVAAQMILDNMHRRQQMLNQGRQNNRLPMRPVIQQQQGCNPMYNPYCGQFPVYGH